MAKTKWRKETDGLGVPVRIVSRLNKKLGVIYSETQKAEAEGAKKRVRTDTRAEISALLLTRSRHSRIRVEYPRFVLRPSFVFQKRGNKSGPQTTGCTPPRRTAPKAVVLVREYHCFQLSG